MLVHMNNYNNGFKYYSSGSYGVLIKNFSDDFIYKITEFSDYVYISGNNFNEMIYLNYFKNKYPNLYEKKHNNLPIQNISTNIFIFSYFIKLYKIDNELANKIIKKLGISLDNLIIVNKMKFYTINLSELNKRELNINNLYLELEKIILCLHFFHSDGLAHGDLKLLNIVSDKIDFKIIDFGGIKYKLNPNYQCTCTSTYRAIEDFEFEYKIKHHIKDLQQNVHKDYIYLDCPLKSDIWSLGLIFNELVNKFNPIQSKYSQLLNLNNDIDTNNIDTKIYTYLKKKKNINLLLGTQTLLPNDKNNDNTLCIYKINKIIEKMLIFDPNKRIGLDEIYLNLFYQELPDLKIYTKSFNYDIKSKVHFNKFIEFRKNYYSHIKTNLENINEIFLFPFVTNLLDRLIVKIINTYLDNQTNVENKFHFMVKLINNWGMIPIDNLDIYSINICYYSIYIISKLLILKKNINVTKNIYNLNIFFNICKDKMIRFDDVVIVYEYIINILEILNYDIVRTSLFFYPNTSKELIYKFIGIIENYDIDTIIKYIE